MLLNDQYWQEDEGDQRLVCGAGRSGRIWTLRLLARTGSELLRGFFGTLCADFGTSCPFRSYIRDSAAKGESEERAYLSGLIGAPEEIRTPDPQIRSLADRI